VGRGTGLAFIARGKEVKAMLKKQNLEAPVKAVCTCTGPIWV